jgi:hypothetical protein
MYPTCAAPGCPVRFEHCDLHHIRYWEHHGRSDLDNFVPLCSTHHHAAHEGRWHLALHPVTRALTITYPDGTVHTEPAPRAKPKPKLGPARATATARPARTAAASAVASGAGAGGREDPSQPIVILDRAPAEQFAATLGIGTADVVPVLGNEDEHVVVVVA